MRSDKIIKYISDLAHVAFGAIGSVFGSALEFTVAYIAYQIIDFMAEKNIEELKEDIIEYVIGLAIGTITKTLFSILF